MFIKTELKQGSNKPRFYAVLGIPVNMPVFNGGKGVVKSCGFDTRSYSGSVRTFPRPNTGSAVVVSFAEENDPPFHKNFFALLFPLPIQAVKCLPVEAFLYLHRFFHIFSHYT